ncbi:MAG: thioredoxin family protein [Chloroflexota bacterium]|nr:MAG: thioredoxin family protein [Chloroflexota bacterium]
MNGLKEDWAGSIQVLQVNVHDRENRALIERLDAQFTPTFLLFDAFGQEVWRSVGQIDADEVKGRVETLEGSG